MDEKIITPATVTDPANVGVPTQVANPRRTTIRTTVQSVVGLLVVLVPLVNITLGEVQAFLIEQDVAPIPPVVFVVVNVGIGATAFVIGLVSRIMAIPGVAAFVDRYLPWLAPIKPTD